MSTPLDREAALTLEPADEEYGLARAEPDLQADPAASAAAAAHTRKTKHNTNDLSTSAAAGGSKEAKSPSHTAPAPQQQQQQQQQPEDAAPPPVAAEDPEPESDLFSAPPAGPAAHSFSLAELAAMTPEQLLYEFRVVNQRADGFKRAHEVLRRHLNAQLQPARIATLANRITELEGHLKNVLAENRTLTMELKRLDKLTPEARAAEDLTEALTRQTEQTKHFRDKVREYQAAEHERDKALRRAQQQIASLEATNKHLKDKYGLEEPHARTHSPVRGGAGAGAAEVDANGQPFAQTMPPRNRSPPPARGGAARALSPIRGSGAAGSVQSAPAMDRSTLLALKSLQKELDQSSKEKQRSAQLAERYKKQCEDLKNALDLTKRLLNKARQTKPPEESRSRSRKAALPANGGPSRSPSRSPTRAKATTLPDISASAAMERAALRKSRSDARLARTAKATSDRLQLAASASEKQLQSPSKNAWQDQYTDNARYTHKNPTPNHSQLAREQRSNKAKTKAAAKKDAAATEQPTDADAAAAAAEQHDSQATAASADPAAADSAASTAAPASSSSPPPPHSQDDAASSQPQQHSQPPLPPPQQQQDQNDSGNGGGITFLTSDNDDEGEADPTPAAAGSIANEPVPAAAAL